MNRFIGFAFLSIGRLFCVVLVGLAFLVSTGCASAPAKDRGAARASQKGKVSKEGERITIEELDQLTYGFADRYMAYIVSACDEIEKTGATARQRRLAHQVKLVQVSTVLDIVTNADPFTQLLDLTLVVTLQSQKWIDEDLAEEWFGGRRLAGKPHRACAHEPTDDAEGAGRISGKVRLCTDSNHRWVGCDRRVCQQI